MVPDGLDLLFDQIEVVKQPLSGRCNALTGFDRVADKVECLSKKLSVLRESEKKPIGPVSLDTPMLSGHCFCMNLELTNAEELGSQGLFLLVVLQFIS